MTKNYVEEEITLAEFSERFIGNNDFKTPEIYDVEKLNIEVLTHDSNGVDVYKPIKSFVVKDSVDKYYTDGKIKVSSEHTFVEKTKTGETVNIKAANHSDFECVVGNMQVVDIEVADEHTYLANGRLNHNTTSGGKAIAFHSSCRIRLKQMGQLKAKVGSVEQVIGIKTRAQVIKNRMGPPLRSVDYDIYFDSGIDNLGSWLEMMKTYKLASQSGAWYTWVDKETGEEVKFQAKNFADILQTRGDVKNKMYNEICDAYILSYKEASDEANIDNIELSDFDD
jgi:hypothetical protein